MIQEVCSCGSKENIWKGTKRGTLALHYEVRSGKEVCKSGTGQQDSGKVLGRSHRLVWLELH